jgi:Helix-turn-helix domain
MQFEGEQLICTREHQVQSGEILGVPARAELSAAELTSPAVETVGNFIRKRDRPPNRMALAQARHTASQELVYRSLWKPGVENADGRVTAVSHSELAQATGRHSRTVQRAINGLIQKGSIELLAAAQGNRPARYLVFSYAKILRRHQQRSAADRGNDAR